MRRTLCCYAPMALAISSAGCAGGAHSREFDPDPIAAIDGELQEIVDDSEVTGTLPSKTRKEDRGIRRRATRPCIHCEAGAAGKRWEVGQTRTTGSCRT